MAFHLVCFEKQTGRKPGGHQGISKGGGYVCGGCRLEIKAGEGYAWIPGPRAGHKRNASGPRWPTQAEESSPVDVDTPEIPQEEQPMQDPPKPRGGASFAIEALAEELIPLLAERIAPMPAQTIQTIEVKRLDDTKINIGAQHRLFPELLAIVSAGLNAWMAGPAGSGKTTAARNVAKALDLPFYYTGAVSDVFSLLGFKNAQGVYQRTLFREAYENGGVFLWDEIDASDPNALCAFNAALDNGVAAFPDGMINMHADCRIIAAANTWGTGATAEYVGRARLDAATLNRFARLEWDYDADLELATSPNLEWTKRVQQIRERVQARGLRHLVTPRASYQGAKLLAAGLPQDRVEDIVLFPGLAADVKNQLRAT